MIDASLYTWSGGDEWNDASDWQGGDDPDPTTHIPAHPPGNDNEVEFDSAATIEDAGAATWFFDDAAVTFAPGASLDMSNSDETAGSIGINGGSLIFDGSTLTTVGTNIQISSGGSLIVKDGGSATIEDSPGYTEFDEESGSVIVSGAGSSLSINVNQQATFAGLVSVLDGATMTTGGTNQGQFSGSEVKISGDASKLTVANASVIFGGGGVQSTLVEDGGALDIQFGLVSPGAHIEVTGAGSSFHATVVDINGTGTSDAESASVSVEDGAKAAITGTATLGRSATLTVADGAQVKIGGSLELTPGAGSAPTATLMITGKNAKVSVTDALDAGGAGKGSKGDITISDGGSLTVDGNLTLGENSGSSGTLTLTDSGSSLTVKGNLIVGVAGSATLDVDDEASFNVDGEIYIGDNGDAGASPDAHASEGLATKVVKHVVKLDAPGKHTTLREDCIVGDNEYGELDILSGYTLYANQKSFTVGNQSQGDGVMIVSGAKSTLENFSSLTLGVDGNAFLDIASGGFVSGDILHIGGSGANTVAEVDVSDAKLKLTSLKLGASGAKASLTVEKKGTVVLQYGFSKASGASFVIDSTGSVTVGSASAKAGYLTIGAASAGADPGTARGDLVPSGVYLKGGASEYSAKTEIDGGFLDIESTGAAGSGVISFEKGTLALSSGAKLENHIADFNAHDAIGLYGVTANKDSFSNGVLTLLKGNTVVSELHFVGKYDPLGFHLSESSGEAIVTYSAEQSQSVFGAFAPSDPHFPPAIRSSLDFL
jgi:T5SS/PEP-CTERM-associated repeat protein